MKTKNFNLHKHSFHRSILRAYDVRGIFEETLNINDAFYLGRSFASYLKKIKNKNTVAIAYDGRISSPILKENLINGLIKSGIDVIEIGLGPTPMLYFAVNFLELDGGIMVTGSHNPKNHNGFKITLKNNPFFGDEILKLGEIAQKGEFVHGEGSLENKNIKDEYVKRITEDCLIAKRSELLDEIDDFIPREKALKIAWDAGNGATGEILEKLTSNLHTTNYVLYSDIDGNFPNHHPDPTVEKNLEDLKKVILNNNCDLGIAFDGDGDRIGVMDDEGEIIWGDQLLMIYADEILNKNPSSTIIADVKASETLFDEIRKKGGKALMYKTGHSFIKSKMKELNAPLAGEMSGHIFFADKYYGFDDALYAAIRLINILSKSKKSLSEIRKEFPVAYSTNELRINCKEEEKFQIITKIKLDLKNNNCKFEDIDGIRVKNKNGWWLLRASNTGAYLVIRCEGKSPEALQNIKNDIASILQKNNIKILFNNN